MIKNPGQRITFYAAEGADIQPGDLMTLIVLVSCGICGAFVTEANADPHRKWHSGGAL